MTLISPITLDDALVAERSLGRLETALNSSPEKMRCWQSLAILTEAAALASLEDSFCAPESAIRAIDPRMAMSAPRHTWPAIDYHAAAPLALALPNDPPGSALSQLADRLTAQSRGEGAEPPALDGIRWAGFMADIYRLTRSGQSPGLLLLGQAHVALISRAPFGASPFAQRLHLALLPWLGRRLGVTDSPLFLTSGFVKHRMALDPAAPPHIWAKAAASGLAVGAHMLERILYLEKALTRKKIVRRERISTNGRLLDFLCAHPIFTAPTFAAVLGLTPQAAGHTLDKLHAARLLHLTHGRNRVRHYQALALLDTSL